MCQKTAISSHLVIRPARSTHITYCALKSIERVPSANVLWRLWAALLYKVFKSALLRKMISRYAIPNQSGRYPHMVVGGANPRPIPALVHILFNLNHQ